MSTGSSLRPMSTTSSTSCISSGSSAASVRWDDAGLETVKELRWKEKETKRQSIEDAEADAKRKKANHESRRPAAFVRTDGAPLLTLEDTTRTNCQLLEDGEGVISILSAATNDLAQLINHLDLEATTGATPGKSPDASPWRCTAGFQSSVGCTSKQCPLRDTSLKHLPHPLRPLCPAKSRNVLASFNLWLPLGPPPSIDLPVQPLSPVNAERASSLLTFGSRSSSRAGESSISSLNNIHSRNPVFRPTHGHNRNCSSLLSSQPVGGSQGSSSEENCTTSRPLSVEARRQLGMKGTMGGSDVSAYAVDDLDTSNPNSDIPDELEVILANQSPRTSVHSIEDHTSFRSLDSLDAPQDVSKIIDLDNMLDVDEDNTKKLFHFTGELEKLNESGGSDRASSVEQLEKAFKTAAKIDLHYDFSGQGGLLQVDIPPLPVLPSMIAVDNSKSATSSSLEIFPISCLLDAKEPTLLPGSDSISSTDSQDLPDTFTPKVLESSVSSASRPSDGELDKSFKFGGFTKSLSQEVELEKPISFSDIIPSPSRVRALSNASSFVDDSVINSIIAKEVRRGFEFHDYRFNDELHISSYGHVVDAGVPDPFDYGLPSLREKPSSEEMTSTSFSMSMVRPSACTTEALVTVVTVLRRVSAQWRKRWTQFSARQLGRPGIGDKMFDTAVNFGAPLTSISASPPGSSYSKSCSSFDLIMDDEPRSSVDDSLFDKTGHRTSLCSESVFGYDGSSRYAQGHLLPQNAFRPVSYLSINSIHSPSKDDDTMISRIGGGHVRRRSVGSVINASPIVRAVGHLVKRNMWHLDQSGHVRIIEKASIDSTSSSKFGGERMIRATKGLLERQSLEESCLIAEGEDLSASYSVPIFRPPSPTTRSRSSTCTSSSSGVDTPPLSASDGSSISGGSQSSIDLAQINQILANATHPISNISLHKR
ncbi:hypothetical protein F5877DRAFT_85100 [Lentinula edodes]|nr:hypothetical protein F5877DRAFT_85100 [Lentinula edodes]